jgi:hypothetical protein
LTRPDFVPARRALSSTIQDMAATAYRAIEREGREATYQARAGAWRAARDADPAHDGAEPYRDDAPEREGAYTLTEDEQTDIKRVCNEARAELRAGATLAEAWAAATRPADRLGDEEPPVAPWFDEAPPTAPERAADGDDDAADGDAAVYVRIPMAPVSSSRPAAGPRGVRRGGVQKLDADAVTAMRVDRLRGLSVTQIAIKYRVSRTLAYGVCTGSMWGHVPMPTKLVAKQDSKPPPNLSQRAVGFSPSPAHAPAPSVQNGSGSIDPGIARMLPAAAPKVSRAAPPPVPTISHRAPPPVVTTPAPMETTMEKVNRTGQVIAWMAKQPGPVTLDELMGTGIFAHPAARAKLLGNTVQRGLMTRMQDGRYQLTAKGRDYKQRPPRLPAAARQATYRSKRGPKPRWNANGAAQAVAAVSGTLTINAALEKLRQEVLEKQAAIAALEALVGQ